jgi:hypothetical protein
MNAPHKVEGQQQGILTGFQAAEVFDLASEEVFLLVLDPSTPSRKYKNALGIGRAAGGAAVGWEKFVKRGLHTLKHPQYQIIFIAPAMGPIPSCQSQHWKAMTGIKVLPLHVLQAAAVKAYK